MEKNKVIALQFFTNCSGNVSQTVFSQEGSSSMASIRLQLIPAITAARSHQLDAEAWSLHCNDFDHKILKNKPFACIVGKLATHTELQASMYVANSAALSRFKDIGTPIISIYSDNHARRSDLTGSLYRQIIDISSIVVCPTKTLQKAVLQINSHARTYVIEDPWQINEMKGIRNSLEKYIRIVWFGAPSNWKYMKNILTELWKELDPAKKFILTILSSEKAINFIKKDLINSRPPLNLKIQIIQWSNFDQPYQLQKILENNDIALVPSDPNDPAKQGVSHNRVVDSIRAGCIAIASPMPSYNEIKDVTIIGQNIPKMLKQTIKNYNIISSEVSKTRDTALERFSPQSNAKKWEDVINEITNNSHDKKAVPISG